MVTLYGLHTMKTKYINKKMVDLWLNMETHPTGFEPNCWLRLQKRNEHWVQIAGIKILPWKFKQITEALNDTKI